jgi:hypothetical protein
MTGLKAPAYFDRGRLSTIKYQLTGRDTQRLSYLQTNSSLCINIARNSAHRFLCAGEFYLIGPAWRDVLDANVASAHQDVILVKYVVRYCK